MSAAEETLERQRKRIDGMLDFFIRLFLILTILGAVFSAIYGLSAGTERGGLQLPKSATTRAAQKPGDRARHTEAPPVGGNTQDIETHHRLTAALIALSISGAAAAAGAGAGFLFGLPRTLASGGVYSAGSTPPGAPPATSIIVNGASPTVATNTNLEQISDWLTKIIVGVGLTKLDNLPSAIEGFGDRTAVYFGFGGKAFGIAAGLYFLVIGFLASYVLTRTKLTWIFVGSAREATAIDNTYLDAVKMAAEEPVDPKTAPLNPVSGSANPGPSAGQGPTSAGSAPGPGSGAGPPVSTPASVIKADRAVLESPIIQLRSTEGLAARAAAEARAGRLEAAAVLYDDVAKADPFSRHLVDYAGVLGLLGNRPAATSLVARLGSVSSSQQDVARNKMLVGLLRSGLYNGKYEDAISAGEELICRPDEAGDAWIRLWLACAYGQRHGTMKSADVHDPKLEETEKRIVDLLQQAIALEPELKSLVRSLYEPDGANSGDNDLQSLWPDERIDALLGK